MSEGASLSTSQTLLTGFVDAVSAEIAPVLPTRRIDFLRAVAITPLRELPDLYWLARLTLVTDVGQIPDFDALFKTWFGAGSWQIETVSDEDEPESEAEQPHKGESPSASPEEISEGTGEAASVDELLNRRLVEDASAEQREMWVRTVRAARRFLPRGRGRRRVRDTHAGEIAVRDVLAEAQRMGGEIVRLRYRTRPQRQRRVLLLLDISGSLKSHSPDFLRFAHALVHGGERVEVFTFGTRLTRVTPNLRHPDVDVAVASLSDVIADFDGGTRIGEAFATFLGNSRYLSLARGALVLVLSDGLELGQPGQMVATTERLARLAHRLVWLTPLAGDRNYRPATRGMVGILGSLDRLGNADSPRYLLRELERLPELEGRPRRQAAAAWTTQRRSA
ncbi:MAG: VWA domain-containing protein [Thermomicrobiales bacterium]